MDKNLAISGEPVLTFLWLNVLQLLRTATRSIFSTQHKLIKCFIILLIITLFYKLFIADN